MFWVIPDWFATQDTNIPHQSTLWLKPYHLQYVSPPIFPTCDNAMLTIVSFPLPVAVIYSYEWSVALFSFFTSFISTSSTFFSSSLIIDSFSFCFSIVSLTILFIDSSLNVIEGVLSFLKLISFFPQNIIVIIKIVINTLDVNIILVLFLISLIFFIIFLLMLNLQKISYSSLVSSFMNSFSVIDSYSLFSLTSGVISEYFIKISLLV